MSLHSPNRRVTRLALGICLGLFTSSSTLDAQVRSYNANFANVAPTIDGVIGADEWSAAAEGGGNWTLLRTPDGGDPDNENNRFKALWNLDGFYLLAESDYDAWAEDINGQNPAPSDFAGDFLNVFLDPNTLGEANGQFDDEIDNYQLGFNLHADERSCGSDGVAGTADDCSFTDDLAPDGVGVVGSSFGSLTAAHVDGLFNNDGEWGHLRATHVSYNISDDESAVIEMFMPWSEFDALAESNKTGVETGLHHPFAPEPDDVWFFNVTRQSSNPDNFLPQWNWTSSQFFAAHADEGHGELRFVRDAEQVPGDYNGNGELDAGDLDVHAQYIKDQNLDGDVNGDGTVNSNDRASWVATLQNSYLGDANFDGEFNSGDLVVSFSAGKYETGAAASYMEGDWDGDMVFDSADFVVSFAAGGYEIGPRAAVNAVPEPASLTLLLTAVAGFAIRRRSC